VFFPLTDLFLSFFPERNRSDEEAEQRVHCDVHWIWKGQRALEHHHGVSFFPIGCQKKPRKLISFFFLSSWQILWKWISAKHQQEIRQVSRVSDVAVHLTGAGGTDLLARAGCDSPRYQRFLIFSFIFPSFLYLKLKYHFWGLQARISWPQKKGEWSSLILELPRARLMWTTTRS